MSLERAVTFCKKCHEYSKKIKSVKGNIPNLRPPDSLMLLRDNAQARAMEGLEVERLSNLACDSIKMCYDALKICRDCDYSSPKVAEFYAEREKSGED